MGRTKKESTEEVVEEAKATEEVETTEEIKQPTWGCPEVDEKKKFYKVVIKPQKGFSEFNGERFGMLFSNGVGRTDNEYTAMRLKAKGYEVSEIEE